LIDRILLAALNLDDADVVIQTELLPLKPLATNENGPQRKEQHWTYTSGIGMLLYLASNSRPDIQYTVILVLDAHIVLEYYCSTQKGSKMN